MGNDVKIHADDTLLGCDSL